MTQPVVLTWPVANTTFVASVQNVGAGGSLKLNPTFPVGRNQNLFARGPVIINGFSRSISITSATTDLSGSTVIVNGTDAFGNLQTSGPIAGPAPAATVYTTLFFKTVTSITSTSAAVGISAGIGILGQSDYVLLDYNVPFFGASVAVHILSAANTLGYSVFQSLDKTYSINNGVVTAVTNPFGVPVPGITNPSITSAVGSLGNDPAAIVWMVVNATGTTTAANFTFTILQQGVTSA